MSDESKDYFNPADADFGIKHLHGIEFKGKKITAEFARRRRRMRIFSTVTTTTTSTHTHSQSFDNDDGSTSGPAVICYRCGTEGHRSSSPDSGARPRDHSARTGSRDYDNAYHGAQTSFSRSRTRELSDRYYDSVDKPQVDSTPNTRFKLDHERGRYYSRAGSTTPYDDTNPIPLYTTFSPYPEYVPSWQHKSSYDNKYNQRSISPSYRNPLQRIYEDVDRGSAHSRGYTRSRDDSAQGHINQTNRGRQTSDPDSVSDVNRYSGNYREERTTTAHRYYSRSPSPRLRASRRNAVPGDHESYYSRDFFEASVPQSAYHY
ncbi:hypothetical protein C8R41DRAFT_917510 [Lentinula lateritia]|uniref:Uncharacterized protein n=1 Tax=Lentinula lateritia TaxID=40482 RepID=A0ABQ8VQL3_9AGAR|nr:hypothetical protein C8R41DRAFT_917510 [Lentinula lateritia]